MSATKPVSIESRIIVKAISWLSSNAWLSENNYAVYEAECGTVHLDESCIFVGISSLKNIRGPLWNATLTLTANSGNASDPDKSILKALDALCGQAARAFKKTPSSLNDNGTSDSYNVDGVTLSDEPIPPMLDQHFTLRPQTVKLFISYNP